MKTATYRTISGEERKVNYDEDAPCIGCGEPVIEASMGGTLVCPWCDIGKCRYCGIDLGVGAQIREHMAWHKKAKYAKEQW